METDSRVEIPDKLYFRIGDVARLAGVKPYVLRYWESEFPLISPGKSNSGQRVYRRSDVENIILIKHLLYEQRFSIEGARKRINELRKEGELRSFKHETVNGQGAGISAERAKEIATLCRELRDAVRTPISKIFIH